MTRKRTPLLCSVADCIHPAVSGWCSGHLLAWHRDGWAERAFKSDDARPPERLLHAVGP